MDQGKQEQLFRPKASLIPIFDATAVQGRVLQRNGSAVGGAQTAQQAEAKSTAASAAPTAPAGVPSHTLYHATASNAGYERLLAASTSPKPFRAGFAYERQQTPEYKVQQGRLQEQQAQRQGRLQHAVNAPARSVLQRSNGSQLQQGAAAGSTADTGSGDAVLPTAPAADAADIAASSLNKQKPLSAHRVQWNGDSSSTCSLSSSSPSNPAAITTTSPPDSSINAIHPTAESLTAAAAHAVAKMGILRSMSRSRGSGTGSTVPRSAVVGGTGLLQGHNAGQSLYVLESLVAESLAMLPPDLGAAAAAAVPNPADPSHTKSLSHSQSGSRVGSAYNSSNGSHGIAAAAMVAGAAAAAAVRVGSARGGRRLNRNLSEPDDQEEEEAALAAMLMVLPCVEPPAVQAVPQQFSLPLVAAALGQDPQLIQQQQQQQQHRQRSAAAVPGTAAGERQAYYPRSANEPSYATSNVSNSSNYSSTVRGTMSAKPFGSTENESGSNTMTSPAGIGVQQMQSNPLNRLPIQTDVQGVELKMRVLSAAPALAQQYTKAQMLLAQTFGADLQQQPAAAAATVAAEAARAAAAAGAAVAAAGGNTGRRSARKTTATAAGSAGGSKDGNPAYAAAAAAGNTEGSRAITSAVSNSSGWYSPTGSALSGSDALSVLLSGRHSPVRTRILTASAEQQRKRQQQRFMSASYDFGSGGSSRSSNMGMQLRSSWDTGSSSRLGGMRDRPFCITPEPWLYHAAGISLQNGSNSTGLVDNRSISPQPGRGYPALSAASRLSAAAAAAAGSSSSIWAPGASGSVSACSFGSDSSSTAAALNGFSGLIARNDSTPHEFGGSSSSSDKLQRLRQQQREGFEFEQHLRRLQNTWKQPTADQVDAEVALSAPTAVDVDSNFAWGDVGRLIRRYQQQSDLYPAAFNLNNALSSRQQVAALAQALPQMPKLTALLLRNNDLDDWALQLLISAIQQPSCSSISCLDLGYNRLSAEAARVLLPLLHRSPGKAPAAAAAVGEREDDHGYRHNGSAAVGVYRTLSGGVPAIGAGSYAMLTQLVLAGNPIGDVGAEVVCQVVATGDSMLQLLDLSNCSITERVSGCLRGLLEGARQLQVLRMGWNNLGPKGGKALAEGLKYCSTLQQLLLPWSGISDIGASHIAKALESNSSVKLLDMSGCQVSAATCVVLVETLSVNKELELLVLQDNPLGAAGAHKLLRAVHAGQVKHVDIAGCGFLNPASITARKPSGNPTSPVGGKSSSRAESQSGQRAKTAAVFDAREPDGSYTLDLATPADRQVAVELLKLAADHGTDSWVNPTLNKKPYSIAGVTKQQLPSSGILSVAFAAKHKPNWEAVPLTDAEFDSMWTTLVDPQRLATTAAALEHELNLGSSGLATQGPRFSQRGLLPMGSAAQQQQQQQSPQDSVFVTQSEGLSAVSPAADPTAAGQRKGALTGSRSAVRAANAAAAAAAAVGGSGVDMHVHAVTDGWKMELLQVLIKDCYFTSAQARTLVSSFSYGEDKVDAAVKVFGRVIDPENFSAQVYTTLNSWQVELADQRIGCLKLFSPANPTGKYSLLLSHPAQRLVAVRLLELFCQQHIEGYCAFPHSVCFSSAVLGEQELPPQQLAEPTKINLPRSGLFKVTFVDLKPIPVEAKPVSAEGFAVLVGVLVASRHLDARSLAEAVDDVDVATKVSFVGRFDTWNTSHGPFTGKISALRRLAPGPGPVVVKDMERFVETMHMFAIHHYLTGAQLIELVKLLPERVELCSCFWARLVDRAKTWSDVMRALGREEQVALAQRLGYANVFDPVRPAMHYRLRMWRADDHQIAWRLHRMALTAQKHCFIDFSIDGVLKKIREDANLWTLMRGSAGDKDTPTVTLDFDFDWEDAQLPQWAAVTIQAAWRAYKIRKANPPPVHPTIKSSPGRPSSATGVRASSRLGARPSIAPDPGLQPISEASGLLAAKPSMLLRPGTGTNSSGMYSPGAFAGSPSSMKAGVKPEWDMLHLEKSANDSLGVRAEYESPPSRLGRAAAGAATDVDRTPSAGAARL